MVFPNKNMAAVKSRNVNLVLTHPGQEVLPDLLGSQITAASAKQPEGF
jgi:hypothetical protein